MVSVANNVGLRRMIAGSVANNVGLSARQLQLILVEKCADCWFVDFRLQAATARNRTEAYHQLQGLIRKIYRGVFKGKKIENNQISAHAVRLVANSIIAYNAIILNTIYERMLAAGTSQAIINEFARISPIAWSHIAFTGKYNFRKSNGDIDVDAMANELEEHLKRHFWKVA